MTRSMVVRSALSAAMIALAALACSDAVEPPPPPAAVARVDVSPPTSSLIVGEQVTLRATPRSASGQELEREVTWTSENATRATVTDAGVVTALAVGEVGIRATSEGRVGRSVLTILPVPPVPVAEVRLSVDEVVLEWDGQTTIRAEALDAQGNVLENRAVEWMSSRPSVATVSQGTITAVSHGNAMVTAVIEGRAASVGVTVRIAPITQIFIEAPTGLEVGEVTLFAAPVKRATGQLSYEAITWTTSAPTVAAITDVTGGFATVSALAEGNVLITAAKEGQSASVTLRVTPRATHDLIYNRWAGDASEIFTMDLATDGSVPVRLNAGNVSREPSPSPDGTQFVFAVSQLTPMGEMQNDLYIVNRNGLNMRWLTRASGVEDQPQWSPDGTKILFHGIVDGRPDLFTINVDGTGLTNLTSSLPADMSDKRHPAWSFDGNRIAFTGVRGGQHKVWTINADGSNARQITTDVGFDTHATFSPGGDRIAFTRYDGAVPANGDDVMIVGSTGGTPTRLALLGDQRAPAWSPDGFYIAVNGTAVAGHGIEQIYTLRPDGTALRLRTLNPAWGGGVNPAWIKRP